MKMFQTKGNNISGITMFSKETSIHGEIKINSDVFIEGRVEGDIYCSGHVTIGRAGEVIGKIMANKVTICGYAKGVAEVGTIELLNGAKVFLEIQSEEFIIEQGVLFEGTNKKINFANKAGEVEYRRNSDETSVTE